MSLSSEAKSSIIQEYGRGEADTGSPECKRRMIPPLSGHVAP